MEFVRFLFDRMKANGFGHCWIPAGDCEYTLRGNDVLVNRSTNQASCPSETFSFWPIEWLMQPQLSVLSINLSHSFFLFLLSSVGLVTRFAITAQCTVATLLRHKGNILNENIFENKANECSIISYIVYDVNYFELETRIRRKWITIFFVVHIKYLFRNKICKNLHLKRSTGESEI